jgi:hypothetical protein
MTLKQRFKLYAAEDAAMKTERCWFASVEAAGMWLDKKVATRWWRKASPIRHVKLLYPFAGGMSGATLEGNVLTIAVRPESLNTSTLIHELAHGLAWVPGHDSERDHGPRYARALIECYRHFDSASAAAAVEDAFDDAGVRYDVA